jgi:hypothetical protein
MGRLPGGLMLLIIVPRAVQRVPVQLTCLTSCLTSDESEAEGEVPPIHAESSTSTVNSAATSTLPVPSTVPSDKPAGGSTAYLSTELADYLHVTAPRESPICYKPRLPSSPHA